MKRVLVHEAEIEDGAILLDVDSIQCSQFPHIYPGEVLGGFPNLSHPITDMDVKKGPRLTYYRSLLDSLLDPLCLQHHRPCL